MLDETGRIDDAAEAAKTFVFPASSAQKRLWFLDCLEPGAAVYTISRVARISGRLDVEVFERSLQEIVRRHEVLRTTIRSVAGDPFQVVSSGSNWSLNFVDLTGFAPEEQEPEADRLVAQDSRRPFDLARGPLLRGNLLRLSEGEHLFALSVHHIVFDGWSLGVFCGELAELYDAFSNGQPSPLPPLPIQYADYSAWQREQMEGTVLEAEVSYWRTRLAGAPALLEMPTDRPRPRVQGFRGAQVSAEIPEEIAATLRRFSRSEGVTLFMTLLAAFQTLLFRYTEQEDVVVGTPIAGRVRTETENLIGLFANELALRTDLSGNPSFRALLARVRSVTLEAYTHQTVPFDKVVEELQPPRSLSHSPIFQVVFALDSTPRTAWKSPGLTVTWLDLKRDVARADLSLFLKEEAEVLSYSLEYNTDLFDEATMLRLTEHFRTILESAVANPDMKVSDLPMVTSAERHHLVVELNDTRVPHEPYPAIHRLFEEHARRSPDAIAVVGEDERLSYGELNARANQVAHFLRRRGVGPDVLVGICMDRSVEMIVGLLGILKAGGAYVPIDPAYPKERISFLLSDSAVPLLLSRESLQDRLPGSATERIFLDRDRPAIGRESRENPDSGATAENIAYAIYTSGSTGQPKGVLIRHGSVANLFAATRPALGFGSGDVWTVFHSYAFDLSVWEIWGALLHGARLVMVSSELTRSPLDFARLLACEGVTVISQTPAAARQLAAVKDDPDARAAEWRLRLFICGGEALPTDLAAGLLTWDVALWNFYGPTEATVWTAIQRVEPADCERGGRFVPIGRPIANTEAYILDRGLAPVPIGVAGDLYIGGEGLAREYLERPGLTAERFIRHPFDIGSGARLYKTGDRARRLSTGGIEFLKRDDNQVKIRGYRVELGEIETALTEHPGVLASAVIVREDEPGDSSVVAYFVPGSSPPPAVGALRGFLQERLPEYMMPRAFVALDALPLTANAKVDRRALPAPDRARPVLDKDFIAPRTPTEERMAEIWRRLLQVDPIGIDDNFFELGGHSLKAAQAISRVKETFGKDLSLRSIFEFPTISELARRIDETAVEPRFPIGPPPLRPVPRGEPLPLSFGQQRLWFLDQLEPGISAYNVSRAVRIRGELEFSTLQKSIEVLQNRHESLRTYFVAKDGVPGQLSAQSALPLHRADVTDISESGREAAASRVIAEETAYPFDLGRGPLWRILLLRLASREHVLVLTIHHIVSDGWSLGILFHELGAVYSGFHAGRPAVLPKLTIQYADYAVWQRQWLSGAELERLLGYWRARLAGAPGVLSLPSGRPRPDKPGARGASHTRMLPPPVTRGLEALSRGEGVTLFTTLLAAFQMLLCVASGQRDVVVGTDVANRTVTETEGVIGFFVNLLPIRTDLSGNPGFREVLSRAREATLGAYAHQDLPFERLVEELQPTRIIGINPLVQTLIVQNAPEETPQLDGLAVERYPLGLESSRFDLVLFIRPVEESLRTVWLYDAALFDAARIERMAAGFERLLESVVARPDAGLDAFDWLREEDEKAQAREKEDRQKAQASRLKRSRRHGVNLS